MIAEASKSHVVGLTSSMTVTVAVCVVSERPEPVVYRSISCCQSPVTPPTEASATNHLVFGVSAWLPTSTVDIFAIAALNLSIVLGPVWNATSAIPDDPPLHNALSVSKPGTDSNSAWVLDEVDIMNPTERDVPLP
jgi:hypothetical protein